MGYEINSPVKQLWLPLEYDLINSYDGDKFRNFAKEYKEKYGIDLHDIFELIHSGDEYRINIKFNCVIGCYAVPSQGYNITLARPQIIESISSGSGFDFHDDLLKVQVSDNGNNVGFGFGVRFGATEPTNIDDLDIILFEI